MKRSGLLLVIAALLGFTAIGAFTVYRVTAPTVLRVAVGPVGNPDTKLVVTILQFFAREKHPIRLRLIPSDGPVGSADMLRAGKADLALVRSDGNLPPNAATVAILHRDPLIILAPARSGIKTLTDLRGKKIGIGRGFSLNQKLVDLVLAGHGVLPEQTTKTPIRPGDMRAALAEAQVDVVALVAPSSSTALAQTYQEMHSETGEPPVILSVPDAEALAQRYPTLETATILRGTFGGSPLRPAESVDTIAITHRLVADRNLKEAVVGDLAKALFEIRQSVAAEFPNFARIEAPNTEILGPLVVHPGAAAFFDGEQKTFIEQYGEWIYIGIMGFSLIGSVLAAMLSRRFSGVRPAGSSEIDRMLLLMRQARAASTIADLDRIQGEADVVFGRTVERAAGANIDETVLSAFTIALGELRTAVEERRRLLSHELAGLAG